MVEPITVSGDAGFWAMVLVVAGVLTAIFGWVLRHERAITSFSQWKETTTAKLAEDAQGQNDFAKYVREHLRILEIEVLGRKK